MQKQAEAQPTEFQHIVKKEAERTAENETEAEAEDRAETEAAEKALAEYKAEVHLKKQLRGKELAHLMQERRRSGSVKPRRTKEQRAELNLPIKNILNKLKSHFPDLRVLNNAGVFIAAVLEYITSEIFDLAGESAKEAKKNLIEPNDIILAIKSDQELHKLLCFFDFFEEYEKYVRLDREAKAHETETENESSEDEEYKSDSIDSESITSSEITDSEESKTNVSTEDPYAFQPTEEISLGKRKSRRDNSQGLKARSKRKRSRSTSENKSEPEVEFESETSTEPLQKRKSRKLVDIAPGKDDNLLITRHGFFWKLTSLDQLSQILSSPHGKRLLEMTNLIEQANNKENTAVSTTK